MNRPVISSGKIRATILRAVAVIEHDQHRIDELRAILAPLLDDPLYVQMDGTLACPLCHWSAPANTKDWDFPHAATCPVRRRDELLGR